MSASRTFKINRKYYDNNIIFKKSTVSFDTGITVLIGCNGSGKTTLLKQLESQLKKLDIPVIKYDNLNDGGDYSKDRYMQLGMIDNVANLLVSSEGESINFNFSQFASVISTTIRKLSEQREHELWVLLDSLDSGISIDVMLDIKNFLTFVVEQCGKADIDIYIIVSSNNFEFVREATCLDVYDFSYDFFSEYEIYKSFILKSRKRKDKRKRKS